MSNGNGKLPQGWRLTRFDEFLRRIERKIILDDSAAYNCVGVRWYGMGAFVRETLPGLEINRKQQWVIKAGDIVYNKLFAWKNAFAIADESVDGCIVSDKFPTYEVDMTKVDPRFLGYYFRMPQLAQQAQDLSKGAAAISKLTLNPPQFWELTIPLPPLDEQQRILERIDMLASKIEEAQSLRRAAAAAVSVLERSASKMILDPEKLATWPVMTLGDVAEIRAGVTLGRTLNGETINVPYLRVANVQDGYLDLDVIKEIDILIGELDKWQLQSGDVLLTEGGDWDKLGRGTVWRDEIPMCIHQNHIFRVRADPEKFDPDFLAALISSPYGKEYFQGASKQTTNLASINQTQLRAFKVFCLPLDEQRRIVAYFEDLKAKADTLKRVQAGATVELEALLPSVLDQAFRGEL